MFKLKEELEYFLEGPETLDFYTLFIQLSAFLESGNTLLKATEKIGPHQKNKYIKKAMAAINIDLLNGIDVATAFKKQNIFPAIVPPTLSAGIASGEMNKMFKQLADKMWLQSELESKVKSALLTPKISAAMMILMVIAFAKIIIPKYAESYKASGIELPWITSAITNSVDYIFNYWYITLLVFFLILKSWTWFTKNHIEFIDKMKLKIPLYNNLHFSLIQYQLAANLALMINAGMNIATACQQTAKIVENELLRKTILKAAKSMVAGNTMYTAFKKSDTENTIDPLVLSLIDSGEETGTLSSMMLAAADIHKANINAQVDRISTKLTIIVILPIGIVIVALYVISLMPMMNYFSQIVK